VTGQDDSKLPGPGFPPEDSGSSAGGDVVELGGRWRPASGRRLPPIAVILAAAGLLAGLIGGYAAGDQHSRNSAAPPSSLVPSSPAGSPAAPSAAGAFAVEQSGRQCSAQLGRALQLGVQVTNLSAASVTLRRVQAVLPLGGLKATSRAWGPCGELPVADTEPDNVLPAGASTWFTVTFQVLVACPGAFPVQFTLDYDQRGRSATIDLPGFVDLGHVPYTGCP
jgi:hypothetical protein